jgi:hypothetical protein
MEEGGLSKSGAEEESHVKRENGGDEEEQIHPHFLYFSLC